ncbi:patatin-like phospholipase family protein [Paracoccus cavernae]|uniref:Patatin-like phospholipase family protein n=1 Tax=Paracoccus cavernae TaxID=1571207 RepID=A0ABT8D4D9_9RHOB|nr:patatin-like phospholipase family protein [Paracoccus cavernae]
MRQEFGDSLIEDLPLNAFAVASNLSTHEVVVQRRGLCWRAVRASAAIPAALPPLVTESGEVLIDGAIMDNVPVSQMRRLKSGPNIAVILSPEDDWRISRRHDSLPSRRRLAGELALRRHDGAISPRSSRSSAAP